MDETSVLPVLGKGALGVHSSSFYNPTLESKVNQDFRKAFNTAYPKTEIGVVHIQAWDAMKVIYRMVGATGGKPDGDKAVASVKGFEWESPRGPVRIDPATRDIQQRIYIRRVTEVGSKMVNKGIDQFEPAR